MHLVLLPLYDNEGKPFPQPTYDCVRTELTERFGGLTAYMRSPATGLWKESEQKTVRDELIIYEVMNDRMNADWWKSYREDLRKRFRQDELIVRANEVQLL